MDKDRFIELLVKNFDGGLNNEGIHFLDSADDEAEIEKLLIEYRGDSGFTRHPL